MSDAADDITTLLRSISAGDHAVWEELLSLLYNEIYSLADRAMKNERRGHTLQPTALMNELFLNLKKNKNLSWENRSHFLKYAKIALDRILIDYARRKKRRIESLPRVPLDPCYPQREDPLDIRQYRETIVKVFQRFRDDDEHKRLRQVLYYRLLLGYTLKEIADELKISENMVKNDWKYIKARILLDLKRAENDAP